MRTNLPFNLCSCGCGTIVEYKFESGAKEEMVGT